MIEDKTEVTSSDSSSTNSSAMRERVVVRAKSHEDELLRKLSAENTSSSLNNFGLFSSNSLEASESLMITSAVELTDDEKERIVRKFIKTSHKPLKKITTVVDSKMLSGIRLQSESFYYEISGQKTLRELQSYIDKSWIQEDELN